MYMVLPYSSGMLPLLFFCLILFPCFETLVVSRAVPNPTSAQSPRLSEREGPSSGKVVFVYFPDWVDLSEFNIQNVPTSGITHLSYSFADINPATGEILLSKYEAEELRYPTDKWESGTNLYGHLKQLYLLKLKQRNLKVLLSIGGGLWSGEGHFDFVTSPEKRATFVTSAISIIETYGFDGYDLDYEFPTTSAQGQGLADLMTELRVALDELQRNTGDAIPYLITTAVNLGPVGYTHLNIPQMDKALDYWNMMAYDYSGPWTPTSEHQSNFFCNRKSGFCTEQGLKYYAANGASLSKATLGMPIYGRVFENTGGLGKSYTSPDGEGIIGYKDLPLPGGKVTEDTVLVASYSYDSKKRQFITYDTPGIVKIKSSLVHEKLLAGVMFWEITTDRTGPDSLINISSGLMGQLDSSLNHISFPNSKWDNLRRNFGQQPGNPTPPAGTSSTSQSRSSSSTSQSRSSSSTSQSRSSSSTSLTITRSPSSSLPTGTQGSPNSSSPNSWSAHSSVYSTPVPAPTNDQSNPSASSSGSWGPSPSSASGPSPSKTYPSSPSVHFPIPSDDNAIFPECPPWDEKDELGSSLSVRKVCLPS